MLNGTDNNAALFNILRTDDLVGIKTKERRQSLHIHALILSF